MTKYWMFQGMYFVPEDDLKWWFDAEEIVAMEKHPHMTEDESTLSRKLGGYVEPVKYPGVWQKYEFKTGAVDKHVVMAIEVEI